MMELLKCPFCGGEVEIAEHYFNTPYWKIKCSKPHCIGQFGWAFCDKEDAIAAWNRRIEPDELIEFRAKYQAVKKELDRINQIGRTASEAVDEQRELK